MDGLFSFIPLSGNKETKAGAKTEVMRMILIFEVQFSVRAPEGSAMWQCNV